MKKSFFTVFCLSLFTISAFSQDIKRIVKDISSSKPLEQTQILLLGSTHFGQEGAYKGFPKGDLFSESRQKEVAEINRLLQKFNPDLIMIERAPEEQHTVDSLYALFKADKIKLQDIGYGRAEEFQFGYNLAKSLSHNRVYGVNYYESVSNRMLSAGDNIEYFQNELNKFAEVGREVDKSFKEGNLSLKGFLQFLNAPEVLDWTYRVIFVTPAKVKNGKFLNPPVPYQDSTLVNPQYIGAEYISIFYERELKIYSNIVTTQLTQKGKRILVIMGQRHAAALPKIFANDPAYKVVNPNDYLK